MLCNCPLVDVGNNVHLCPKHGTEHVCGNSCRLGIVRDKGTIVCPLTSIVLGRVAVDAGGVRAFRPTATKRRRSTDGSWVSNLGPGPSKKARPLPGISALSQEDTHEDDHSDKSRRATRSEEPLSLFAGILHRMMHGSQRLALERANCKKRFQTMLDAGRNFLKEKQRKGKPGSLVDAFAVMLDSVSIDGYRLVGVPGPLLDDIIHFLATYIQGAYRRVAPIRDQLQAYSLLPESKKTHGITRGQGSRATVKMDPHTFTVQIVKIMGRGGMRSLIDQRVLIPAFPLCELGFPPPGQMGKVIGKMSKFKLEPLLRQADKIENELVGDPTLTVARAIPAYEDLVVEDEGPVVRCSSILRMPGELGPFCVYEEEGERAFVLAERVGYHLGLQLKSGPYARWEQANKHCSP